MVDCAGVTGPMIIVIGLPPEMGPVDMLIFDDIDWRNHEAEGIYRGADHRHPQKSLLGNARDVCRRHNITETTFYHWRNKFGGMEVSEAKRLSELERENSELKKMVAEQALDIHMLKDVVSGKW